jgi:uncharacterized protein (TIGR03083 family)
MNAADILKYGHQSVLGSIEGLPEDDWETPGVCGVWSVKNIIAHLTSYEYLLVDAMNRLIGDGPFPTLQKYGADPDGFNDAEVDARRDKSVADTLAEFNEAHAQTMQLLAQIPVDVRRQAGTLPWYGEEYALDDFIVYACYGHKREHTAQIAVFRDTLEPVRLAKAA